MTYITYYITEMFNIKVSQQLPINYKETKIILTLNNLLCLCTYNDLLSK